MPLRSLCVLSRVLLARVMYYQRNFTEFQSLHLILYTTPLEASLSILSFGFLKGLGHAILGNFSTDQIVIELT